MKKAKVKKDIQEVVKAVLYKKDQKARRTELRIVHWIIDGVDKGPQLEKRDFLLNSVGQVRTSRRAGFNKSDWKIIMDSQDDIGLFFL